MSFEDEFEDYHYFGNFDYDDDEYDTGYQDQPSEFEDEDVQDEDTQDDYSPDKEDDDDYSPDKEDDDEYYKEDYDPSTDYGRIGEQGEFFLEERLRYRSVRDVILARMYGILGNTEYSDFSNEIKNKSMILIEKIPEKRVILLSIDVLVPVALYMSQYKKQITKSNVTDFLKRTSGLKNVEHLDFIRYVRIVKNLEDNGLLIY